MGGKVRVLYGFFLGIATFFLLSFLWSFGCSNFVNWYQIRNVFENIKPLQRNIENIISKKNDLAAFDIGNEEMERLRKSGGGIKGLEIFDSGMIVVRGGASDYAIIMIPLFDGNSVSWHYVCGSDYMMPRRCSE
jgi:cadmium resistance protein CadD (predicted permease)